MKASLNKFLTIGIILWVVGIALFCYVRQEQGKYNRKLQEEQLEYDFIIGSHEDSSAYYAWNNDSYELIRSVSISCMIIGAGPFTYWFLSWFVRLTARRLSWLVGILRRRKRKDECPEIHSVADSSPLQSDGNVKSVKEVLGVVRSSGESNSYYTNDGAEKIGTLYCDAKSLAAADTQAALSAEQLKQLEDNIRKTIMSGYRENAHAVEQSIKVQGESLGKHLAEFREVTETVKAAALNENKSSDTELGELAQQISAIRDYTSCQQDRIEKLQDGYDWTIIRTFCLKIIRCIDNLENRIRMMSENGLATEMLEDIRDELLFSLESSSVEQFDLEVNSEYRGNEKLAEVVKDKSPCEDESMKGKIASLIRPGYQYVIDEESTKVVRIARVKLFG